MVLEEAKILEKKIIITDTAAREAVEGYSNKIILENTEEGIYNGLLDVLENNKQEGKTRENEEKKEQYDNSSIIEEVKELIGE